MSEHAVPFHLPEIGEGEIRAVTETLRSGWLTTGQRTKQFEQEIAQAVHATHAVATNSGTAALHLALEAVGVKEGDEVILPTMTFAATADVVSYLRAKPVLVDSEPGTLNLDPDAGAAAAQGAEPDRPEADGEIRVDRAVNGAGLRRSRVNGMWVAVSGGCASQVGWAAIWRETRE